MIEYLMSYVDKLEDLNSQQNLKFGKVDERNQVVDELKKFVLDDIIYAFIDEDIKVIQTARPPTRDLISNTVKRWEEFASKYPKYLDKQGIRNYIVGQLIQEE